MDIGPFQLFTPIVTEMKQTITIGRVGLSYHRSGHQPAAGRRVWQLSVASTARLRRLRRLRVGMSEARRARQSDRGRPFGGTGGSARSTAGGAAYCAVLRTACGR